jgi:hypothetical protein
LDRWVLQEIRRLGLGSQDDLGAGPIIYQGSKTLPGKQVTFDTDITAIEEVRKRYQRWNSGLQHLLIHSDSTSAIARSIHSGAGPGQRPAKNIVVIISVLEREGRTAEIQRVEGLSGERADRLASGAAEKTAWSKFISLAHLKLRISEKF